MPKSDFITKALKKLFFFNGLSAYAPNPPPPPPVISQTCEIINLNLDFLSFSDVFGNLESELVNILLLKIILRPMRKLVNELLRALCQALAYDRLQ